MSPCVHCFGSLKRKKEGREGGGEGRGGERMGGAREAGREREEGERRKVERKEGEREGRKVIDNFTVSKRMLMKRNCYVTSHPEYTPCPTWRTFPLKSVLNMGEFEICALASCTVFSNETIANQ